MKTIVDFINKEKLKIIFALLGLLLSILFIVFYNNYPSNIFLIIIFSIISIFFGSFQMYFLYFKERTIGIGARLLLSLLSTFLFIVIVFTIIVISRAIAGISFNINALIYAIYLLPSFIIVLMIIMLLLICLSYA